MVLRDRNHPSVIMWSIGNEIQERSDDAGIEIAERLRNIVKKLDPSRPVTAAINDYWDNPQLKWKEDAAKPCNIWMWQDTIICGTNMK